jgi:cell division protein FtsW (lipid II flippase)
MSDASRLVAGLLLVLVPTVEFGGAALLWMIARKIPGYLDNPSRRMLFRAGHAHAGVLVILALVAMLYVDRTALSEETQALVRWLFFAAPLLISMGFFFSMLPARAERPNGWITLTYAGAVCLAAAVLILGVTLLRGGLRA